CRGRASGHPPAMLETGVAAGEIDESPRRLVEFQALAAESLLLHPEITPEMPAIVAVGVDALAFVGLFLPPGRLAGRVGDIHHRLPIRVGDDAIRFGHIVPAIPAGRPWLGDALASDLPECLLAESIACGGCRIEARPAVDRVEIEPTQGF